MKRKHRLLLLLMVLILAVLMVVCSSASMVAFAESEEVVTTEPPEEEVNDPTLWTRIAEWGKTNKAELVTGITSTAILAILTFLDYKKNKKIKRMTTSVNLNTKSNDDVIDTVNALVGKHNETEARYIASEGKQTELMTAVRDMIAINKANMQILVTVYQNSKNLPQGVKDLVNQFYADALKTVSTPLLDAIKQSKTEVPEEEDINNA